MKREGIFQKLLRKQWSFFWAGVAFGVAQIIYMVGIIVSNLQAGKDPVADPITVTTDLGRMFRAMEVAIAHFFNLPDPQLFGHSADGVPSGGAFVPGVGWQIIGMAIGGALVALAEREFRTWVKYPPRLLLMSFIGGVLFSYGTRLAGGCTLNHLIGGIPLLSIHSTVTVLFMAIGGILAFYLMAKLDLAKYFKHQETACYVKSRANDAIEAATYDPGYNPRRQFIWWFSLAFFLFMFGVAIYGGIFNPEWMQHLKKGELVAFSKSVADKGLFFVLAMLLAGIVGGFGMAKSGYGTECAVVSAEVGKDMARHDGKYAALGVPKITRTLMKAYLPAIGLAATWVIMLAFIVPAWIFFGVKPGFEEGIKYQLTMGNVIGGLLLGFGSVLLIGCEIRSYMRLGLGYLNTWVGFIGFAVGYLPFTLFHKQHEAFFEATRVTEVYKWYQLFFPNNPMAQKLFLAAWWIFLIALLLYLVRVGAKQAGATPAQVVSLSTEELQLRLEYPGGHEVERKEVRSGAMGGASTC